MNNLTIHILSIGIEADAVLITSLYLILFFLFLCKAPVIFIESSETKHFTYCPS